MSEGPAAGQTSRFGWMLRQLTSRLWFRVSLYGFAALATALIAGWAAPFVPPGLSDRLRDGAARELLTIVASSMLVVVTFALGTMVQAFSAAAQIATPRATGLLIDDPVSQNVLSTLLGAFVFSMVALVAHSFSYYGEGGEVVLVAATAIVVAGVISTFFGWLDHLANLVRLGETIRKLADRARGVLQARARAPHLGGVAPSDDPPDRPVMPTETGYVRHVDMPRLQGIAEAAAGRIAVACTPGKLADPSAPLARTDWDADDATRADIRGAFTLGPERTFDQDPRLCLQVLTEIASRALSPGVNDPGTAIGIIATLQILLTDWSDTAAAAVLDPDYPSVEVPALSPDDLMEDAFAPLHRDAAPILEVGVRLQKTLAALAANDPVRFGEVALRSSRRALDHADRRLDVEDDRRLLAEVARRVEDAARPGL